MPDPKPEYTHHVKCRKAGETRWRFVAPGGRRVWLRVHASLFTLETAKAFLKEAGPENPQYEFKAQRIWPRSKESACTSSSSPAPSRGTP